ncbi:MAG: GGDEF domain-containing protein, partial [Thiovulaceae bacterium]|nr:GGDEF domain-containing protein [Sulfurimonadaceae bacterium]
LYYLFTFLHYQISPTKLLPTMIFWHLYIVPTILLFVALITYLKKHCVLMTSTLIAAPIIAAIANMHIISNIDGYTTYQTELYLIIFWVFTVSGLRLIHSTNTALIIFLIAIINSLIINPMQTDEFVMHMFWMLASLSFGFLGAYLYEDANKKIFLNHKDLEKNATTDNLTGVYNRRKFDEIILYEFDKTKRYKHRFGIIMIDIDYFKSVNDIYGHNVGDKVLIEMSELLKKNIRESDVLIRWGGEEFIIICFEINEESILNLAEKIRKQTEQSSFYKIGKLTLSIGVTLNKSDDDIDSITKRADKALYNVKNSGRNRVEVLL